MKRAVLCVTNPQDYIDELKDFSIMILNPNTTEARQKYLLDNADYTIKITANGYEDRMGGDYPNEKLFWYTSGTTGDSKFCSFTQEQLDILSKKICQAYNITANDRYTSIMPLWHAHGQGFYWATRLAGCETNFITLKEIKTMPSFNPTFVTAVPDILKVIGKFNFNNLRFIRGASAALPNALYTDLKEKFKVPIIEAFGMTEALSHCFTNPLYGEQRMGTIGLPDGIEADIVDGQLFIKGPTVFVNDWYSTGDLADRDEAGYFRILGRHRDQINIRGKKFNPISLESQLRTRLAQLTDCVVFGTDNVRCLYIGNCSAEDIQRELININPQCRPTMVKQVDEIPISPSGKISRSWLSERF